MALRGRRGAALGLALGLAAAGWALLPRGSPPAVRVAVALPPLEALPLAEAAAQGPLCPLPRAGPCLLLRLERGGAGEGAPIRAVDGLRALRQAGPAWPVLAPLALRPALVLVARRGYPAGPHFLWHDLTGMTVAVGPGLPAVVVEALIRAHGVDRARVAADPSPGLALRDGRVPYAAVDPTVALALVRQGEARLALRLSAELPPLAAGALLVARPFLRRHPGLIEALRDRLDGALRRLRRGPPPEPFRPLARAGLWDRALWPSDPYPRPGPWLRLARLAHLAGRPVPPPELIWMVNRTHLLPLIPPGGGSSATPAPARSLGPAEPPP